MPFFTSVGLALGATAASAATVGAVATTVGVGLAANVIYGANRQNKAAKDMKSASEQAARDARMPIGDPTAPDPKIAAKASQEAATKRKRAISRSKSVRTSPLGVAREAEVARKTLLGS